MTYIRDTDFLKAGKHDLIYSIYTRDTKQCSSPNWGEEEGLVKGRQIVELHRHPNLTATQAPLICPGWVPEGKEGFNSVAAHGIDPE